MTDEFKTSPAPAESGMGTFAAVLLTAVVHWALFLCVGGGAVAMVANERRATAMRQEATERMREEKQQEAISGYIARIAELTSRKARLEAELEKMRRVVGDDPRFKKAGGK